MANTTAVTGVTKILTQAFALYEEDYKSTRKTRRLTEKRVKVPSGAREIEETPADSN